MNCLRQMFVLVSFGLVLSLAGCTDRSDNTEKQPIGQEKPAEVPAAEAEKAPVAEAEKAAAPEAAAAKQPEMIAAEQPAASAPAAKPANPIVIMQTNKGTITLELWPDKAPSTVENFLTYVRDGFYDGTIFHRVISGFMIQGGGFTPDMNQKPVRGPIKNEAAANLPNLRGTISMARTNAPHSATSQFFINHKDNAMLNYQNSFNPGYAVFGKVVSGMEVVDAIAAVSVANRGGHEAVPSQPVIIEKVTVQNP